MVFGASAATVIGGLGLALGAGTAIAGATSGGSGAGSGGSAPSIYTPPTADQTGQNTNFLDQQSYITGQSPWSTLSPNTASVYNNLYNDPYASGYQNYSANAGNESGWAGNLASGGVQQVNNTAGLIGNAGGLYSAAANNPYYSGAMAGTTQGAGAMDGVGASAIDQSAMIGQQNIGALGAAAGQYGASIANPYNSQTIGSAATGGNIVQNQSLAALNNAGGIMPQATGQANMLDSAAGSVLNTAFDPQNALYNQQFQLNTDQTRAGLEARGLDTSAAGQGIENTSDQNFNIAWQNAQLGRQTAGLSSAQSATGQALSGLESGAGTAQQIGTAAGQNYAAGGAMPGQAYTGIQNTNQTALQNYLASIGAVGQNAAAANTLGAAGANQMVGASQMPYNLAQGNANNAIAAYGNVASGSQGYAGMYGTAAGLGGTAASLYNNAGALPYNASQTIGGNQGTAVNNYLNTYNTAMTPYQQSAQNSLQYLGYGVNANNAYANAARGSWAQGQQAYQAIGSGIQGLTNSASNVFGSPGSNAQPNSIAPGVGTYTPNSMYAGTPSYSPSAFNMSYSNTPTSAPTDYLAETGGGA